MSCLKEIENSVAIFSKCLDFASNDKGKRIADLMRIFSLTFLVYLQLNQLSNFDFNSIKMTFIFLFDKIFSFEDEFIFRKTTFKNLYFAYFYFCKKKLFIVKIINLLTFVFKNKRS